MGCSAQNLHILNPVTLQYKTSQVFIKSNVGKDGKKKKLLIANLMQSKCFGRNVY